MQPRFISYILPTDKGKFGFEAAILSPASEEVEFTIQHFDQLNLIERTAGDEHYSGYLRYRRKYDDTWAGFGVSYQINEQWYIGASSFLSIKTLQYRYNQQARAFQELDSVSVDDQLEPRYIASNGFDEETRYWDLSWIFKLGLQFKTKNQRFGVGGNITFPSIRFIGRGNIRKTVERSNVYDNSADQFTANNSVIEVEEDVRTRVKTPFSTAIGMQYFTQNRKNTITFTFEYFNEIDPYAVLEVNRLVEGGDYLEGIIDANKFMSYYHSANTVTNFALGFKQYVGPKFFFLGGFRTDFTAGSTDNFRFIEDQFKFNQFHIDNYHVTLGPVLRIKNKFDLTTGLQYTRGRNRDFSSIINYADPVEYIPQTGQALQGARQADATARIDEFALFFGMTVDLK